MRKGSKRYPETSYHSRILGSFITQKSYNVSSTVAEAWDRRFLLLHTTNVRSGLAFNIAPPYRSAGESVCGPCSVQVVDGSRWSITYQMPCTLHSDAVYVRLVAPQACRGTAPEMTPFLPEIRPRFSTFYLTGCSDMPTLFQSVSTK